MPAATFAPSMLNNISELRGLFAKEQTTAIQEIEQSKPTPFCLGKGKVAWIIVTSPFNLVFSLVMNTLSTLLACLYVTHLSRSIHYFTEYLERDLSNLFLQFVYGSRLLTPSHNTYKFHQSKLYQADSIKREDLLDPTVQQNLDKSIQLLNLYQPKGLCRGSVYWFTFLFQKVLEKGFGKEENLSTFASRISLQFKDGVPLPGALLQALHGLEGPLLYPEPGFFSKWKDRLFSLITPSPIKQASLQTIAKTLHKAKEGVYLIMIGDTTFNYVKTGQKSYMCEYSKEQIGMNSLEEIEKALQGLCQDKKVPFYISSSVQGFLPEEVKNPSTETLSFTKTLKDGLYHIQLHDHIVAYLKCNGEELVWNPNTGLIKIEKPEQLFDELRESIKEGRNESISFAQIFSLS